MVLPSLLVTSQGRGLIDLPLRASNEGSPRPRVARAQEINRPRPTLFGGSPCGLSSSFCSLLLPLPLSVHAEDLGELSANPAGLSGWSGLSGLSGFFGFPISQPNERDERDVGAGLSGLSCLSRLSGWPDRKPHQKNQRDQTDRTDRTDWTAHPLRQLALPKISVPMYPAVSCSCGDNPATFVRHLGYQGEH